MPKSYAVKIEIDSEDYNLIKSKDFKIHTVNDWSPDNCYLINNWLGDFDSCNFVSEDHVNKSGRFKVQTLKDLISNIDFESCSIKEPTKKIYKHGYFGSLTDLLKYVNDENLDIVSITPSGVVTIVQGQASTGYDLVYLERDSIN